MILLNIFTCNRILEELENAYIVCTWSGLTFRAESAVEVLRVLRLKDILIFRNKNCKKCYLVVRQTFLCNDEFNCKLRFWALLPFKLSKVADACCCSPIQAEFSYCFSLKWVSVTKAVCIGAELNEEQYLLKKDNSDSNFSCKLLHIIENYYRTYDQTAKLNTYTFIVHLQFGEKVKTLSVMHKGIPNVCF